MESEKVKETLYGDDFGLDAINYSKQSMYKEHGR